MKTKREYKKCRDFIKKWKKWKFRWTPLRKKRPRNIRTIKSRFKLLRRKLPINKVRFRTFRQHLNKTLRLKLKIRQKNWLKVKSKH